MPVQNSVQAFFIAEMKRRKKKKSKIGMITAAAVLTLLLIAVIVRIISIQASREKIMVEVARYAAKHRVPAALVGAVINQESSFDPFATGKAGEIGLMQLMPPGKPGAPEEWARVHRTKCPGRLKLYSIDTNINIGCWYLAQALKRWKKYRCGTELALVEYNAGFKYANLYKPENFDGEVIPRIKIASTKKYVTEIMENYRRNKE